MGKVYEGLIKPCIFWDGNSSYYHATNCVNNLDIQYVYNASITWNWARQVIKSNTDISDFSFSSADAKAILKNHILLTQKMGNSCEWNKYRDKLVLF